MKSTRRKTTAQPIWRIYQLRAKGEYITSQRARTAKDAVKQYVKEHGINEAWQRARLIARPD